MKNIIQRASLIMLGLIPAVSQAHPGHDQHSGFSVGFLHPFTGMDHMIMALALGVLLWSAARQWKILGMASMATALVFGFVLGQQQLFSSSLAEYGIIASLLMVTLALWSKSRIILPVATALLVTFHGIAHGNELGHSGHIAGLVSGMIIAMSLIYTAGLGLGALITRYIPYGKKIVGACAAIVALIGLA